MTPSARSIRARSAREGVAQHARPVLADVAKLPGERGRGVAGGRAQQLDERLAVGAEPGPVGERDLEPGDRLAVAGRARSGRSSTSSRSGPMAGFSFATRMRMSSSRRAGRGSGRAVRPGNSIGEPIEQHASRPDGRGVPRGQPGPPRWRRPAARPGPADDGRSRGGRSRGSGPSRRSPRPRRPGAPSGRRSFIRFVSRRMAMRSVVTRSPVEPIRVRSIA